MSARWNLTGQTVSLLISDAGYDAALGNCETMRNASDTAGFPYQSRDLILGLALCGEPAQAQRLLDKTSKQFPVDTLWNLVRAPSIQAAVELKRNDPVKAIEVLQSAVPFERGYPYVMYLRGLAYLQAHEGPKAITEFRNILDHKGAYWMSAARGPYYPLSYLGLARAAAMSGDTAKSKKAYQDFLTLWKDADPDLAPLIQARQGYAALE